MYTAEEYDRRAHIVNEEFREQLNRKSLKYNWHDAQVTVLEGVMARGDRRVGAVIEEAYRLGCLFDSWTESSVTISGWKHSGTRMWISLSIIRENVEKMRYSRGISLIRSEPFLPLQ